MIDIVKCKEEFEKFVKGYNMSDKKIRLKYDHTFRVCDKSVEIAESLGLSDEDKSLAFLIALLHDIGRFEQERIYGTFNDLSSADHATLGCKVLFEQGLIRKFISDPSYDEIIEFSIRNHNKYMIEDCLDERKLMHSKIIRDADKIDILNIVLFLGGIGISEDDLGVSKRVRETFYNEKSINHKDKKTKNDSAITMLSFIFDLNYQYTYQYFKDRNYVELFYEKVKNKELFGEYINYANAYVERKCNCVRNKI